MTKEQYRAKKLHEKALRLWNEVGVALEQLSVVASCIVGEDLTADLCNGGEIEFRKPGHDMETCMRIEDILTYTTKSL